MSHFATAVLFTKNQSVYDLMEPYEESPDKGSPFLVWSNQTKEVQDKYETGTSKAVRMPDGRILFTHDEEFRIPGTFATLGFSNGVSTTHKIPDNLMVEDVPLKELYKDVDKYAKDYHGYTKNEAGEYGYFSNPNAKWDYWQYTERLVNPEGIPVTILPVSDVKLDELNVWAFVAPDGTWIEKGTMGWWAMNDATEESREAFDVTLKKALDKCGEDVYITILDCHI